MKTFIEWLDANNLKEGIMPNMGQQAIPINQPQQQQAQQPQQIQQQPQQVSLSSLAHNVKDPNWHHLHDAFGQQFQKHPNDPQVLKLGQALYQAAQTGNMTGIQPFVQQHFNAQQMR